MRIAFIFPGQGSQYPGMGKEIYEAFRVAREVFEEASDSAGIDIAKLCFYADPEELTLTSNAQPAIFTVSMAVFKVFKSAGVSDPVVVGGHSLGEITAVCSADALGVGDSAFLVRKRGEFMESAVKDTPGGMSAIIGIAPEKIEEILKTVEGTVQIANYNSPDQTVISGDLRALEIAEEKLASAGARRIVRLSVSAPFHSVFMREVGRKLREVMETLDFRDPRFPVTSNVSAKLLKSKEEIKDSLERQVYSPVRWIECMKKIAELSDVAIEAGPKNVLRGLARKIVPGFKVFSAEKPRDIEKILKEIA